MDPSYQRSLSRALRLSDRLLERGHLSGRQIASLWHQVEAGNLLPEDFIKQASELAQMHNTYAADLAVQDWAISDTDVSGRMPSQAPRVQMHASNLPRISEALETIISLEDIVMRLERFGRAEVAEAAGKARSKAIKRSGASGWVRGMESDACQLCNWWWREGRVWSPQKEIQTHKGCVCVQVPVYDRSPQWTVEERNRYYQRETYLWTIEQNPEKADSLRQEMREKGLA